MDVHNDYNITMDDLEIKMKLPPLVIRGVVSLGSIVINIVLSYFVIAPYIGLTGINQILFSIGFGIVVYLAGFFGGLFWRWMGRRTAQVLYRPYVQTKKSLLGRLYIRFAENDSSIFFEARSKDETLRKPINLLKLIFHISLAELGFYITISAFFVNKYVTEIQGWIQSWLPFYATYKQSNVIFIVQSSIALGLSVFFLALYFPMSMIITGSNLRTFNTKERTLGTPSSKIRSRINSLVGIGALTSGWSIFNKVFTDGYFFWTQGKYDTFWHSLDYVTWLVSIMLISWPLITPAAIYFMSTYEKTINRFRSTAIKEGVPIGVSKVRAPQGDEQAVVDEFVKKE